jgi:hypothetical protein
MDHHLGYLPLAGFLPAAVPLRLLTEKTHLAV